MKKKIIIFFLIVVSIIAIFFIYKKFVYNKTNNKPVDQTAAKKEYSIVKDNIKITSPKPKEVIKSPVTITGEAKGSWFFEGLFPIQIIDNTGILVGNGTAKAEGEWMTENFVPFSATIPLATASSTHGFIIIKKDNPSGLPENDDSLQIPILFSN